MRPHPCQLPSWSAFAAEDPLDERAVEQALIGVSTRRYENKSVVMTTNLAFSDWPTIFPNATCATALIDRTVHHADVVAIEGDSYRRREAEADKKTRRTKKAA